MSEQKGIINAFVFEGNGKSRPLESWDAVSAAWNGQHPVWLHLYLDCEESHQWLHEKSGLDAVAVDSLAAEDPRPRCDIQGNGLIAALRGVNLNPGADPDDMISVRLWVDAHHVITVRRDKLMAINDIREEIVQGQAPNSTGEFLATLAMRLVERMEPVIGDLDARVDVLEDTLLCGSDQEVRGNLALIRREAIGLRRYISPQREALSRLFHHPPEWINGLERNRLREVADGITRYVEDLDSIRERAAVMQDEIATRLSERINRNMYLLSIVAALFLPLTFVTGLLGINVGGIPGSSDPFAFIAVCMGLATLVIIEIILFRRMNLLNRSR
jgi:zinc transporter